MVRMTDNKLIICVSKYDLSDGHYRIFNSYVTTVPITQRGHRIQCEKKNYDVRKILKVKVKVTLEPATKAQRGSRGIALLFL